MNGPCKDDLCVRNPAPDASPSRVPTGAYRIIAGRIVALKAPDVKWIGPALCVVAATHLTLLLLFYAGY